MASRIGEDKMKPWQKKAKGLSAEVLSLRAQAEKERITIKMTQGFIRQKRSLLPRLLISFPLDPTS
jgi:hypothetical protein